jgi:RsmE family RNA methyltransferase
MQCRRPDIPDVGEPVELRALMGGSAVAMADRNGSPPTLRYTTVVVGPEGGWADEERALRLPAVALGDHVLRAETAAVTVGALWAALRAGRVTEVAPG